MNHPLGYLHGSGSQSVWVTPLLWYSLIVSILVCVIIGVLVLWGVIRRRATSDAAAIRSVAIVPTEGGAKWIWIGIAISMAPLLVSLFWTMAVLAKVGPLPTNPPLTIDIAARQWWWDARYEGVRADQYFHTANEIHIPVGRPVLLRLTSPDVIHSFWVPKLAGKMDVIPGQTNLAWIEAKAPGHYLGHCAEFCGFQHAKMAFIVIAESPERFRDWWTAQLKNAPAPVTAGQQRGLALVEYRCSLCHAVRGTEAEAHSAPDLTHLMSRETIAAGTLPNNMASLSGWIENPQASKPGALMPNQALSGQQLDDLRAYLGTLK